MGSSNSPSVDYCDNDDDSLNYNHFNTQVFMKVFHPVLVLGDKKNRKGLFTMFCLTETSHLAYLCTITACLRPYTASLMSGQAVD